MSKITRTESGSILSKAVEYHGFVYLQGVTARDSSASTAMATARTIPSTTIVIAMPTPSKRP